MVLFNDLCRLGFFSVKRNRESLGVLMKRKKDSLDISISENMGYGLVEW